MSSKLGEMLISKQIISEAQLKNALDTQKQIGGRLGTILVKLRYVTEEQLATFLGEQLKIPVMRLPDLVMTPAVSAVLDVQVLEKHHVLPIRKSGDRLQVASVDPMDLDAIDELQFATGMQVDLAVASRSDLVKAIDYYFHGKPCLEIKESEKAKGVASGQHLAVQSGTRASPHVVLQALTELLIEKKVIAREELLAKIAAKQK
jgi:hypothetical protein